MKTLPLAALLGLALAGCGHDKFAHPVAVVAHADVKNTNVSQGTVEPGDTVDLVGSTVIEGEVQVALRNGKRGFVPVSALALPDSLRAKL